MEDSNSLHIACMLNDTTRVKHLLHAGAHRNAENTSGTTALELADFLHRVEVVKLLLRDVDIKEMGGYELLRAIRIHHVTVVRALLEMGVREELGRDEAFFRGVLTMACCVGNAGVLEVLVKYGPEVEVVSLRGVLVQCALAAGNTEVVDSIGHIVGDERRIQGSSMDSASDDSAAPSMADCVTIEPSLYSSIHGRGSAIPMRSGDLWQTLRGL